MTCDEVVVVGCCGTTGHHEAHRMVKWGVLAGYAFVNRLLLAGVIYKGGEPLF